MGIRLISVTGLLSFGLCAVCCAQSSRGTGSGTTDLNRWSACKISTECAPVLGPCGDAASTGNIHAAEYRAWANEQRPRVECARHCFKSEAELSSYIQAGHASNECLNRQCKIVAENLCPVAEGRNKRASQ